MPGDFIKALLFDFDGVVIETELPAYQSWQEIFLEHGQSLSIHEWAACLGTVGGFDPIAHLEGLIGRRIDEPDSVRERRWKRKMQLLEKEYLRPGIERYLTRAAELRLQVAIVSSDTDEWIQGNLRRVGRTEGWDFIICANGDAKRAKPNPCLYEEALKALRLSPSQAVAFEDSPNGIKAAKSAGLFCVAVANPVSKHLDLSAADLYVESLDLVSLDDVLAAVATVGLGRSS